MAEPTADPNGKPTGKPAGMRRGLRILLVLSLGLNLVILAVVGGAVLSHQRGDRPERVAEGLGAYIWALEPTDRRALGRDIREHYRGQGLDRRAARAEFANVLAALKAETFDADLLRDLLVQQAQSGMKRREAALDLWLTRIEAMSAEERQAYAARIEAHLKDRKPGKRGPRGDH